MNPIQLHFVAVRSLWTAVALLALLFVACAEDGSGGPVCGDGQCEPGETRTSCAADCSSSMAMCGNGTCEAGESASSCAADCSSSSAVCGNGICEAGESVASCSPDCEGAPMAVCGNGVCEAGEDTQSCAGDCPAAQTCGDGMCSLSETCSTCMQDCGACPASCGDGTCTAAESCTTCAADCGACPPTCGDGACNGAESCTSCAQDCGACPPSCGDGMCNGSETCSTCFSDCGQCPASCGDGTCDAGENATNCPGDCPCSAHGDCSANQICISGACNLAWGRSYRITVIDASIAGTDPSTGSAWDALGGAPDPFVAVYYNGNQTGATMAIDDTFMPIWNATGDWVLEQSNDNLIGFAVWDEDVDIHDFIIGMEGTDAQWLGVVRTQGGVNTVTQGGSSFTVFIEPL